MENNIIREKLINIMSLISDVINSLSSDNKQEITQQSLFDDSEFITLKNLLYNEQWPNAVEDYALCDPNKKEDKEERGEYIASIIDKNLSSCKVLDFGCGDGYISKYISKDSLMTIGYDINEKFEVPNNDKLFFTNDFEKVLEKAPYDYIFIHDVIDHVKDPIDVLNKVYKLCSEKTDVFLRCHCWCSKHGAHYYNKINKAFLNLIFTEEEIIKLGLEVTDVQKIIYPIKTYKSFFEKTKFSVVKENIEREEINSFFYKNDLIKYRIMKNWNRSMKDEFPKIQMEQTFVNFNLKIIK